ncbi:MAG: hypothetical protein HZA54_16530 [Planctomycetes bacterium]|nr:hypothetical protein [Planctomycetota bacterium]
MTPVDWRDEAAGVGLIGGASIAVLAVAELWARLGTPKPEWTRKLVHVGGGVMCLLLPFLVHSITTAAVLGLGFTVLLVGGSKSGMLKSLTRVERKGHGSELYPLAIFLMFLLAHDRPWLFVCSILVLAVADALAAVIGSHYGVIRYEVDQEEKSLEGSLVFLVVAFLATHLPMLLLTDLPRERCVLAALLVSLLVTGVEAISLAGTDNLFIPFAVYAVLDRVTERSSTQIASLNVSLVVICTMIGVLAWRARAFNVGGTLTFMLFAFGGWALGNVRWGLPVLFAFAIYMSAWLVAPSPSGGRPAIKVGIIFRALFPSLAVLVAAYASRRYDFWYAPYVCGATIVLSFSLWIHVLLHLPLTGAVRTGGAIAVGLFAWLVTAVVPWIFDTGTVVLPVFGIGGVCVVASILNDRGMGATPSFGTDQMWPLFRFLVTLGAVTVMTLLQVTGFVPAWAA